MSTFETNNLNIKIPKKYNKITKYERARLIGIRASQIQYGAPVIFSKKSLESKSKDALNEELEGKNTYEIAKKEFNDGLSPLIIVRNYPSGEKIQIAVQELI